MSNKKRFKVFIGPREGAILLILCMFISSISPLTLINGYVNNNSEDYNKTSALNKENNDNSDLLDNYEDLSSHLTSSDSNKNYSHIVIDGDPYDWNSSDLIAADTTGETSATALDLLSLCYREENGELYFRVDFKNQWTPLDAGWKSPLFTYLSELNMRILISFKDTDSIYKSMPGIGTEFVNVWNPWLTSTEPKTPTNQGWDYAVVLDFKRNNFDIMTPDTLTNPTKMGDQDYAVNLFQGMVEFKLNITYAQRGTQFHAVVYTINESTTPWTPADVCPNAIGGNTHDYSDDGNIDAYADSKVKISPAKLAIVWHANQALGQNKIEGKSIVETYIDGIKTGFSRVIGAHLRYDAPVNLHWSGTLLSGMQWYTPDFIKLIKNGLDDDLIEIMTSTFGQSIMTWLPEDYNIFAINTETDLIERLFNVRPEIGWVPERCWKEFIFDDLLEAGIKGVLLDPQEVGSYLGYSPPEDVLYATPTSAYLSLNGSGRLPGGDDDPNGIPSWIRPGALKIFIINNNLQGMFWDTCVSNNYQRLVDMKSTLAYYASLSNPNKILVVGSDMEIPGGHPYGYSWDGNIGDRYDAIIKLLAGAPYISLQKLSDNLDLDVYDTIDPGFENSSVPDHFSSYGQPQDFWYYGTGSSQHSYFANESPNRTAMVFRDSDTMTPSNENPQVPSPIHSKADIRSYEQIFLDARSSIQTIEVLADINSDPFERRAALKLLKLANYTLLTTMYETAWCDHYTDPINGTGDWLANWGKILWAHAHHAQTLAMIANWTLNPPNECKSFNWDIDGDSYDEYIVETPYIFMVIEKEGGRISFLSNINGSLLIGNPLANYQITKADSGGSSTAPVEDYFNPLTLNGESIQEYYQNYEVVNGLTDFFAQNAKGGYPINNGSGGFFYAVPYSFPNNQTSTKLELQFRTEDLPDTAQNESEEITKVLEIDTNSPYIQVKYILKSATNVDVYSGFSPDLLKSLEYGKKYFYSAAFDTRTYSFRGFFNSQKNEVNDTASFTGIGWNSSQNAKIIDLTAYSKNISINSTEILGSYTNRNDSTSIYTEPDNNDNNTLQNLYPDYGEEKPLTKRVHLRVSNNSVFYIYTPPDFNSRDLIKKIHNADSNYSADKIKELIDTRIQNLEDILNQTSAGPEGQKEQNSDQPDRLELILNKLKGIVQNYETNIITNNFGTYIYGYDALIILNLLNWFINTNTDSENNNNPFNTAKIIYEDLDMDGNDDIVLQNKFYTYVIDPNGAKIRFAISSAGDIITPPHTNSFNNLFPKIDNLNIASVSLGFPDTLPMAQNSLSMLINKLFSEHNLKYSLSQDDLLNLRIMNRTENLSESKSPNIIDAYLDLSNSYFTFPQFNKSSDQISTIGQLIIDRDYAQSLNDSVKTNAIIEFLDLNNLTSINVIKSFAIHKGSYIIEIKTNIVLTYTDDITRLVDTNENTDLGSSLYILGINAIKNGFPYSNIQYNSSNSFNGIILSNYSYYGIYEPISEVNLGYIFETNNTNTNNNNNNNNNNTNWGTNEYIVEAFNGHVRQNDDNNNTSNNNEGTDSEIYGDLANIYNFSISGLFPGDNINNQGATQNKNQKICSFTYYIFFGNINEAYCNISLSDSGDLGDNSESNTSNKTAKDRAEEIMLIDFYSNWLNININQANQSTKLEVLKAILLGLILPLIWLLSAFIFIEILYTKEKLPENFRNKWENLTRFLRTRKTSMPPEITPKTTKSYTDLSALLQQLNYSDDKIILLLHQFKNMDPKEKRSFLKKLNLEEQEIMEFLRDNN